MCVCVYVRWLNTSSQCQHDCTHLVLSAVHPQHLAYPSQSALSSSRSQCSGAAATPAEGMGRCRCHSCTIGAPGLGVHSGALLHTHTESIPPLPPPPHTHITYTILHHDTDIYELPHILQKQQSGRVVLSSTIYLLYLSRRELQKVGQSRPIDVQCGTRVEQQSQLSSVSQSQVTQIHGWSLLLHR